MAKITSRVDPRDESRIFKMEIVSVSPEELPADYYALLGLLFAFLAIAFKIKVYSWLTCLFSISSLANQRYSQMDMKSITANISLIVLTFISTHVPIAGQPVMAPLLPWLRNK